MAENSDDDKLFDKINSRTNKNSGVVEVKIIPQPKVVSASKNIEVVLLNPSNNSIVLDRSTFPLIEGKVPVKMIMTSWKVKKPIWVDGEMPLEFDAKGLSTVAFNNIKVLRITAEPDRDKEQ